MFHCIVPTLYNHVGKRPSKLPHDILLVRTGQRESWRNGISWWWCSVHTCCERSGSQSEEGEERNVDKTTKKTACRQIQWVCIYQQLASQRRHNGNTVKPPNEGHDCSVVLWKGVLSFIRGFILCKIDAQGERPRGWNWVDIVKVTQLVAILATLLSTIIHISI